MVLVTGVDGSCNVQYNLLLPTFLFFIKLPLFSTVVIAYTLCVSILLHFNLTHSYLFLPGDFTNYITRNLEQKAKEINEECIHNMLLYLVTCVSLSSCNHFTIFTIECMLHRNVDDIFPHYDPYVLPQVWADIPLKDMATIL